MLQEREILLRRFQMGVDAFAVFLAYLLTYLFRPASARMKAPSGNTGSSSCWGFLSGS